MISLFPYLAIGSIVLLAVASWLSLFNHSLRMINTLFSIFLIAWVIWITFLWIEIERAPLRTLGETRLWYAFLVPLISWVLYNRNRWHWIVGYGFLLSTVFLLINLLHPENFSRELMPALQSYWFAPHVIVYIFSYALLGMATLIAIHYLWIKKEKVWEDFASESKKLVYTAYAFLTMGLLFGALWAKEAWGHYWTWDPKEVWALATWLIYMIYIHYLFSSPKQHKRQALLLVVAFVVLLLCWFGVNYLPIAKYSVHTY